MLFKNKKIKKENTRYDMLEQLTENSNYLKEEYNKVDKAIDLIIQDLLLGIPLSKKVCSNISKTKCYEFRNKGGCNECIKQYFINEVIIKEDKK